MVSGQGAIRNLETGRSELEMTCITKHGIKKDTPTSKPMSIEKKTPVKSTPAASTSKPTSTPTKKTPAKTVNPDGTSLPLSPPPLPIPHTKPSLLDQKEHPPPPSPLSSLIPHQANRPRNPPLYRAASTPARTPSTKPSAPQQELSTP